MTWARTTFSASGGYRHEILMPFLALSDILVMSTVTRHVRRQFVYRLHLGQHSLKSTNLSTTDTIYAAVRSLLSQPAALEEFRSGSKISAVLALGRFFPREICWGIDIFLLLNDIRKSGPRFPMLPPASVLLARSIHEHAPEPITARLLRLQLSQGYKGTHDEINPDELLRSAVGCGNEAAVFMLFDAFGSKIELDSGHLSAAISSKKGTLPILQLLIQKKCPQRRRLSDWLVTLSESRSVDYLEVLQAASYLPSQPLPELKKHSLRSITFHLVNHDQEQAADLRPESRRVIRWWIEHKLPFDVPHALRSCIVAGHRAGLELICKLCPTTATVPLSPAVVTEAAAKCARAVVFEFWNSERFAYGVLPWMQEHEEHGLAPGFSAHFRFDLAAQKLQHARIEETNNQIRLKQMLEEKEREEAMAKCQMLQKSNQELQAKLQATMAGLQEIQAVVSGGKRKAESEEPPDSSASPSKRSK